MHPTELNLHKRRRLTKTSSSERSTSATPQPTMQSAGPSSCAHALAPSDADIHIQATDYTTIDCIKEQTIVQTQEIYPPPEPTQELYHQPQPLPPCLPHLTSPYTPPLAPDMEFATPEEMADYNMDYLEWRRVDQTWRAHKFFELATFMSTWRDTMISMALICYEGRYVAMREMGVLIGKVPLESRKSLRRRILEGDLREGEEGEEGEMGKKMEGESVRVERMREVWRRKMGE